MVYQRFGYHREVDNGIAVIGQFIADVLLYSGLYASPTSQCSHIRKIPFCAQGHADDCGMGIMPTIMASGDRCRIAEALGTAVVCC